jgi:hypothetical protein
MDRNPLRDHAETVPDQPPPGIETGAPRAHHPPDNHNHDEPTLAQERKAGRTPTRESRTRDLRRRVEIAPSSKNAPAAAAASVTHPPTSRRSGTPQPD